MRLTKVFLFASIGLYIFSLTQGCYCTTTSCGDSIAVLISGAIGFFYGGAALTWLANPLLIISWIVANRNLRISLITSIAALFIAVSFLFFGKVISDEAGHYSKIMEYKSGYWLWITSALVMVIRNFVYYLWLKIRHV